MADDSMDLIYGVVLGAMLNIMLGVIGNQLLGQAFQKGQIHQSKG